MNQEPREPIGSAIADLLINFRWYCLGGALLLGIAGLWKSQQFHLERRLELMFHPGDPAVENYRILRDTFGGTDVVLVVIRDADFWKAARQRMAPLRALHQALEGQAGIREVMDLSVIDRLIQQTEAPFAFFSSADHPPGVFSSSPLSRAMLDLFAGTMHSGKGEWIGIACLLKPAEHDTRQRTDLIASIRQSVAQHYPQTEFYLAGEPVMVEEGFEMIEADGKRLGWTSSIVVTLWMLLVCRSLRWTIVTLVIVQWSLKVTQGACVLAGWELTMVSSMLVAIVTVIGIATTMHWFFAYQSRLRQGEAHAEALGASLRQLIRPMTWACVTDALAFAALMAAKMEPVRDYGLMMSVASLVTLLAILLIVPGLASLGIRERPAQPSSSMSGLFMKGTLNWALRHRTLTIGCLLAWLVWVVIGTMRLKVETDFLRNFKADSALVRGYAVIEEEMGGAGAWDVILAAPSAISTEYLQQVFELEDELRRLEEKSLSSVTSLADADLAARQSSVLARLPIEVRLTAMRSVMPNFFDSLLSRLDDSPTRRIRIMLRAKERMPVEDKLRLQARVKETCQRWVHTQAWKSLFPVESSEAEVSLTVITGYYVLLSQLVQSVVADQWICFAIATLAILLALRVATQSWTLALVALVPNSLPALGTIAALGILGWRLNLGGAMIAAVSIGLSVDSSLHYLLVYQRGRQSGLSLRGALERSQCTVGLPVICATLALVLGFASLSTSDFLPTVAFGWMAATTMFLGIIGNLAWLPVLVSLTDDRLSLLQRRR